MAFPDVKQLDKIIQLCRKRGVKSIKIDNVELTLSESEPVRHKASAKKASADPSESFESDSPTDDELLFWSVRLPQDETKETE